LIWSPMPPATVALSSVDGGIEPYDDCSAAVYSTWVHLCARFCLRPSGADGLKTLLLWCGVEITKCGHEPQPSGSIEAASACWGVATMIRSRRWQRPRRYTRACGLRPSHSGAAVRPALLSARLPLSETLAAGSPLHLHRIDRPVEVCG
jgi:hypothetical protein